MEHELIQTKAQLAEVVDEVLHYQSVVGSKTRQVNFLRQALADNIAAHAFVMEALNQQVSVLRKQKSGLIRKADAFVGVAMDDLRRFQQTLQRNLVDSKLELPVSTFVRSPVPLIGDDDLRQINSNTASLNSSDLGAILEEERREFGRKETRLKSRILDLEEQLKRARASEIWPFKDDHRSSNDGFGMSSNSTDTNTHLTTLSIQNSALRGERQESRNGKTKDTNKMEEEIVRLKRMMKEQEIQHDEQRKALMMQTEAELQDAELQISQLRRQLNGENASGSPRRRVKRVHIHRNGDIEAEEEDLMDDQPPPPPPPLEEYDNLQLTHSDSSPSIAMEQYKATLSRLQALEKSVVHERKEKDKVKRILDNAQRERDEAINRLEELELEHGLGREEFETERSQLNALRLQLQKAHRDREVINREYRAAERRHIGVMEEMKEVMLERDEATSTTEKARREYLKGQEELEKLRTDLKISANQLEAEKENKENLQKKLRALAKSLEVEKRNRVTTTQDVTILLQQKETITMERDAAIREQQNAMKRVDTALSDRKLALEVRDQALTKCKGLEDQLANLKIHTNRSDRQLTVLEKQLQEQTDLVEEATNKAKLAEQRMEEAVAQAEKSKELRVHADQEMEVAQRQCRALGKELRSVLRVRDIALEQRDAALQQNDNRSLPTLANASVPLSPRKAKGDEVVLQLESSRDREKEMAEKCEKLCIQVESMEVTIASLEEEKADLEAELNSRSSGNSHHRKDVQDIENRNFQRDVDLFGLSPETISMYKEKMINISHRLADIQELIRASYITMQSFLREYRPGSNDGGDPIRPTSPNGLKLRSNAVSTATQSQSISDILFTYSKQLQSLEQDEKSQCEAVSNLIAEARKAFNLTERIKVESKLLGKGTRNSQAMERDLDMEKCKARDAQEEVDRVSAKLDDTVIQLRQAQSRVSYLQEKVNGFGRGGISGDGDATNKLHQVESELEEVKKSAALKERLLQNEIDEERLQLTQALERLKVSDGKVIELKRKLRTQLYQIETLETEREKLANHVEDASSQLKGVASQKSHATKELEEVYSSLTELEQQLLASHAENNRLKQVLSAYSLGRPDASDSRRKSSYSKEPSSAPTPDRRRASTNASISSTGSTGNRNVRIKRTGSIVID